ncbi:hypothetical protein TNCV_781691 [Trichonephila clavipes]|nr:hypothetical protein TNCV_781691 [Trichonephila clavipes]
MATFITRNPQTVALSIMQVTLRFGSFPSQFPPWGRSGASHLSAPSSKLTRRLAARWLFRVPPCRDGTFHVQASMPSLDSNPGPTAQQSALITTIQYS